MGRKPESANKPFPRENVRWQVNLAFFLMLHQRLRRAKMPLLLVDAFKSAYDTRQQRMRYWLNVQANRSAFGRRRSTPKSHIGNH